MNYRTTNQTIAAFLLTQGANLQEVKLEQVKNKTYNSYYFYFDIPKNKGIEIVTNDYYQKKTLVAPLDIYENLKLIREAVVKAKEAAKKVE